MTLDLRGIRERANAYGFARRESGAYNCGVTGSESADDVPELIAEVKRLRAVLDKVRLYADEQDEIGDAPWVGTDLHKILEKETTR